MRRVRALAMAVALAGLAGVLVASPASAIDDGTALPGNVYLLNNGPAGLAAARPSDQVTGGTYAGKPFTTIAVDSTCPAGTAALAVQLRLKTGAPEEDWDEAQMSGTRPYTVDADGHLYVTTTFSNFKLTEIQTFLNGTGQSLPLAVVCDSAGGLPLAYFQTQIRLDANATNAGTWNQVDPPTVPDNGSSSAVDTAVQLTGTAAGANLVLTATVTPAAAGGTVAFAEGATPLGTGTVNGGVAGCTVTSPDAGLHTYTATFTPADPDAYNGSSVQATFNVTIGPDGTITVTLEIPPASGDPGSVTLAVPSNAAVSLVGERVNGRVVAQADLPAITVTDTHSDDLLGTWQVNVQATNFVGSGGASIGAKYLGLQPAVPMTVATEGAATVVQAGGLVKSVLDDSGSAGLSQSQVLGKVVTKGRGVTTLGGTLNFAVDSATAAGTYTSTITVTLVGG